MLLFLHQCKRFLLLLFTTQMCRRNSKKNKTLPLKTKFLHCQATLFLNVEWIVSLEIIWIRRCIKKKNLHPWRYSKLTWTRCWGALINAEAGPALSRGLDHMHSRGSFQNVLLHFYHKPLWCRSVTYTHWNCQPVGCWRVAALLCVDTQCWAGSCSL